MRVKIIQSANRLLLNFVEQSLRVERPASRQIFWLNGGAASPRNVDCWQAPNELGNSCGAELFFRCCGFGAPREAASR